MLLNTIGAYCLKYCMVIFVQTFPDDRLPMNAIILEYFVTYLLLSIHMCVCAYVIVYTYIKCTYWYGSRLTTFSNIRQ